MLSLWKMTCLVQAAATHLYRSCTVVLLAMGGGSAISANAIKPVKMQTRRRFLRWVKMQL